jgi:hypothetical protein
LFFLQSLLPAIFSGKTNLCNELLFHNSIIFTLL